MTEDKRQRLEQELSEAHSELEWLGEELSSKPDYSIGEGDPGIYDYERNMARKVELERRIENIKEALERLERGLYGVCERCGEEIDPERLRILPDTTLCVRCKREEEALRRGELGVRNIS